MATYSREILSVGTLLRWHHNDELVLQPKFQRRLAWSEEAKAYLIDTILRGLSMPKIYLRRTYSNEKRRNVYEVVDGQQRLDSILSFRDNRLRLSPKHGLGLGAAKFDDLPDSAQRQFLDYEISIDLMEDARDSEVWAMFERLNTYTLTLNRQERLNAKFFGYFKQTAYTMAAEQTELGTWVRLRVFSNKQIARMREVELTSDVLTAVTVGIRDITYIGTAYQDYDNQFRKRDAFAEAFRRSISFAAEDLGDAVIATRFRNAAWFYSLLVAIADAQSGIPRGRGPGELRTGMEVCQRMRFLHQALWPVETPHGLAGLKEALSRATSHADKRGIRNEFFFKMLTLHPDEWHSQWASWTDT